MAQEKDSQGLLADVIAGDRTLTNQVYNKWAPNYEQGMADVGYFGPKQLIECFEEKLSSSVPKDAKILDVCAGTGGVGRGLVKLGYSDLHAIDGSEGMLAEAKKEGNYKSYTILMFEPGTKLPYADGEFDCVLMAGVFAPGHLPIVALREVCRVTKKGGLIAFICCDPKHYEDKDPQYADGAFPKLIDQLKEEGKLKDREGFPIAVPYIEYSEGFIMAFDVIGE